VSNENVVDMDWSAAATQHDWVSCTRMFIFGENVVVCNSLLVSIDLLRNSFHLTMSS
jgi:hypothetical protein